MSDPRKPEKREAAETVDDADLDTMQGGGLFDTKSGTFGFEPITLERGTHTPEWRNLSDSDPGRYIGETEKNVWKAPAGTE
jgi:hypothetical protein